MSEISNPVKAIRHYCVDVCACGSLQAVRDCHGDEMSIPCPLYPFRFGTNPYRAKRAMTDEQKAQMLANLKSKR